jgi:hypothetical protein
VSDTAEIVELRRIRPVKWSALDKKAETFRAGFVGLFLKYEGSPLLDEDGSPILSPGGRQTEVTARSFARHFGIAETTFQGWVIDVRGVTAPWNQRERTDTVRSEHHGQCSHCPEFHEEGGE